MYVPICTARNRQIGDKIATNYLIIFVHRTVKGKKRTPDELPGSHVFSFCIAFYQLLYYQKKKPK